MTTCHLVIRDKDMIAFMLRELWYMKIHYSIRTNTSSPEEIIMYPGLLESINMRQGLGIMRDFMAVLHA